MVGHDHEGVDLIAAFGAVFVEKIQEWCRVRVSSEEAAAVRGDGDEDR